MNWTNLIKQFRSSRSLNQAELAELCGVRQATVSRWESGKHIPDRATRNRLRAILRAQDSKTDQAIIRSVRFAHTCSGLTLIDFPRVIEASVGGCHLQGIDRADLIKIPLSDWFMHVSNGPEADWFEMKALRNGDLLALHIVMEAPIFKTGGKVPVATTFTPLWFCDGTFALRGDSSILPRSDYHGQSITAFAQDGVTYAL